MYVSYVRHKLDSLIPYLGVSKKDIGSLSSGYTMLVMTLLRGISLFMMAGSGSLLMNAEIE